jgi:hypothetical protein
MTGQQISRAICALWFLCAAVACAPKVQVETKDPIVINMNVKIEHEIRVKVDKELDDLFDEDSDLY